MQGGSGSTQPKGAHVLRWLRDQGALSASQYEGALYQAQRTGGRVEEALLETGALDEATLLKLLASRYETRFVSTERLANSHIDRKTIALLPRRVAERFGVFPILYDPSKHALSIVVAAPGEDDIEKQVQLSCQVRSVSSYVARPAAIRAAIAKFYGGNKRAFSDLNARGPADTEPLDLFDASPVGGPGVGASDFSDPFDRQSDVGISWPEMPRPEIARPEAARPEPARATPPRPSPAITAPTGVIPAGSISLGGEGITRADFLETLNVFVSLLERDRGSLRGHSGQVARLCRLIAERAGIADSDRHALLVAAYLHDVGKATGSYHLTALNVARYEGHRTQAQKSRGGPVKLFQSAGLPDESKRILEHLFERFDGQGFPDRLAGKDIPWGSRVLSMVETYADLTANDRNPYRRALSPSEALSVVRDLAGQLFDPDLADLLVHLAAGEQKDAASRARTLLVDPDAEETTVLELRLIEHGFSVEIARDFASARKIIDANPPRIVITEIDLGPGPDGYALLEHLRALPAGPAAIVLTARSDRAAVSRGFDLGAADYLVKPTSADIVAAKAGQAAERRSGGAGGVNGSLADMALPDVIQVLTNGGRGGRLEIVADGKRGEIHFCEGQIYDASFGTQQAEEAVYAMLKLVDGTFKLDPSFKPEKRVIHAAPQSLLLEGMRRLDEGL